MSHRETIPESKAISGWLFLSGSRRMWQDPYDLVVAGGVYRMEPVGFHWYGLEPSEGAIDAVLNARGPICCRVSAWGEVLRGRDRFVAGSVRVEWVGAASEILRAFAGDGADEDPIVAASRAIRAAMPARPNKQEEKTGKARQERAERAARDRLNERLAGMLEGLGRNADEGVDTVVAPTGRGRDAGNRGGEFLGPLGRGPAPRSPAAAERDRDGR